jgi:hypothetical protein
LAIKWTRISESTPRYLDYRVYIPLVFRIQLAQ